MKLTPDLLSDAPARPANDSDAPPTEDGATALTWLDLGAWVISEARRRASASAVRADGEDR